MSIAEQIGIVTQNGIKACFDGFPRNANPVMYCDAEGRFSTHQAALRDAWFAGWDSAAVRLA